MVEKLLIMTTVASSDHDKNCCIDLMSNLTLTDSRLGRGGVMLGDYSHKPGHVGNYNTFGKTANVANAHEKPVVWLDIWQGHGVVGGEGINVIACGEWSPYVIRMMRCMSAMCLACLRPVL